MDKLSKLNSHEPRHGRRLLINIIDDIASLDPSRPFIFIPCSSEPKDGWKPVTYLEICNAINYVAHEIAIKAKEEPQEESFPTLAYIGPNDVRYFIILLACIKAGHKALLISPRNSLEGQMRLFEATNCNILFYAEPSQAIVEPWLKARPMRTSVVPSADAWLQAPADPFPYEREFDEAQWDPVVVLHTSGTTGFPKPIIIRQGVLSIADAFQDIPAYQGSKYLFTEWIGRSRRMFTPMPLFHIAGTMMLLLCTVFYGAQMTLGIPGKFLTAESVAESIAYADVDAVILPPSILEDLSLNEEWMEQLAKLAWVGFGGGKCVSRYYGVYRF